MQTLPLRQSIAGLLRGRLSGGLRLRPESRSLRRLLRQPEKVSREQRDALLGRVSRRRSVPIQRMVQEALSGGQLRHSWKVQVRVSCLFATVLETHLCAPRSFLSRKAPALVHSSGYHCGRRRTFCCFPIGLVLCHLTTTSRCYKFILSQLHECARLGRNGCRDRNTDERKRRGRTAGRKTRRRRNDGSMLPLREP